MSRAFQRDQEERRRQRQTQPQQDDSPFSTIRSEISRVFGPVKKDKPPKDLGKYAEAPSYSEDYTSYTPMYENTKPLPAKDRVSRKTVKESFDDNYKPTRTTVEEVDSDDSGIRYTRKENKAIRKYNSEQTKSVIDDRKNQRAHTTQITNKYYDTVKSMHEDDNKTKIKLGEQEIQKKKVKEEERQITERRKYDAIIEDSRTKRMQMTLDAFRERLRRQEEKILAKPKNYKLEYFNKKLSQAVQADDSIVNHGEFFIYRFVDRDKARDNPGYKASYVCGCFEDFEFDISMHKVLFDYYDVNKSKNVYKLLVSKENRFFTQDSNSKGPDHVIIDEIGNFNSVSNYANYLKPLNDYDDSTWWSCFKNCDIA